MGYIKTQNNTNLKLKSLYMCTSNVIFIYILSVKFSTYTVNGYLDLGLVVQ